LRLRHDEAVLQAEILSWFSIQYPHLDGLLVGYPGGINLDIKTRCRMKRMGLRAGFPDLQLMVSKKLDDHLHVDTMGACTRYTHKQKFSHGLLIELKTPKGIVTACQKDYHSKLRQQDYTVVICRSFEEARDQIQFWLMRV